MECNNACGTNKLNSVKNKKVGLNYNVFESFVNNNLSESDENYLSSKNLEEINKFNEEYLVYINKQEELINSALTSSIINNANQINDMVNPNSDFYQDNQDNILINDSVIQDYIEDTEKVDDKFTETRIINKDVNKKLKEIGKTKGSIAIENKYEQDIVIYTNLILTAIVTTSLFYIFSNTK
tara:strand:+ start:176 stop:721 length:546 start_codon:yes stop_codon:yes gene_type:complete